MISLQKTSGCGGPIIAGDTSIKNLIKKIGKGPKLAQDLTRTEAKEAMRQILDGSAKPQQIGAFLLAERIKGESAEETAGFVDALREVSDTFHFDAPKLIDLASAHDGKNKSLVLTSFVAIMLSCLNIPVIVTGGRDVPTKKGICASLIFEELGLPIHSTGEEIKESLKYHGFAYWDVHNFCPQLEALKSLRESLGLRTPFNTVEKLINPANAKYFMTGVYHGPYLKSVAEACQLLNYPNVLCAQATEASTDFPLKKRTLYRRLQNHQLTDQLEINPEDYDLKRDHNPEFTEISVQANVDAVLTALKQKQGNIYDALIYNTAIPLWFTEAAPSIEEGLAMAKELIHSGSVLQKIKSLT